MLQQSIAHLLRRPVGRPPKEVRCCHASFSYKAQSWSKSRWVVAKVEWHPGELFPRVGCIVTNLSRPAERVTKFYNGRGTPMANTSSLFATVNQNFPSRGKPSKIKIFKRPYKMK